MVAALAPAGLAQGTRVKPESLNPRYQEWLKLATYILTDKERDVFFELQNDRDRDIFVDMFWKVRDPAPATPTNEYKEEILKRFAEANRRFRFGSAGEGWRSDRGRVYIILGPANSVERIEGDSELRPVELWSYTGDTAKGMPAYFVLVFFRRGVGGDYKLYDPFLDGPSQLLIDPGSGTDITDYRSVYEKIYDIRPNLALVCLSIVPGEIPYGYQPSTATQARLATILSSPKRAVNESYATHFLNYRGIVSTDYLTNPLDCVTDAALLLDPVTGMAFCHFAMAPKRLSVDLYEPKNEYSCKFLVDVSLRSGEKVLLQYSKEFPVTIPADRLEEVRGTGVCIQDAFPVVEGRSKLTVLFRNTSGREFAVLETDLEIPAVEEPHLFGPILGFKRTEGSAEAYLPFQAGDFKLQFDPKITFSSAEEIQALIQVGSLTETLWREGAVRFEIRGSKDKASAVKVRTVRLRELPLRTVLNIGQAIPAAGLSPDYYDMVVVLEDGQGRALDTRTGHFILSGQAAIAHPAVFSKTAPRTARYLYEYMLARQYDLSGRPEAAEASYARAHELNPAYSGKLPEYALFLIGRGKAEQALSLIEAMKDDSRARFPYLHVQGRALMALGRLDDAARSLEEANRIYNSDTSLLNDLGRCYQALGRMAAALAVFRASLKLNPDQAAIRILLESLEKTK